MHELAVAESILDIAKNEMGGQNLRSVRSIRVRVGALSDVVPEALRFGFQISVRETEMAGAVLDIETVSVKGRCGACERDFEVFDYIFECPFCKSRNIELTQGDELEIAYIEVEDCNIEAT